MSQVKRETTTQIRSHHREILEHMMRAMGTLDSLRPDEIDAHKDEIDGFVRFLEREVISHAEGEEEFVYPVIDELIRQFGSPTEVMKLDHEVLRDRIAGFHAAIDEARSATDPAEREAALNRARWVAAQIDSLLSLHLEKENYILFRYLDDYMSQEQVDKLVDEMHGR